MIYLNADELSTILCFTIPILSILFIFIYKSVNKELMVLLDKIIRLRKDLIKEIDKNKGFRHSHYQIDKTIAGYMESIKDDIKDEDIKINNNCEKMTIRIRELEVQVASLTEKINKIC